MIVPSFRDKKLTGRLAGSCLCLNRWFDTRRCYASQDLLTPADAPPLKFCPHPPLSSEIIAAPPCPPPPFCHNILKGSTADGQETVLACFHVRRPTTTRDLPRLDARPFLRVWQGPESRVRLIIEHVPLHGAQVSPARLNNTLPTFLSPSIHHGVPLISAPALLESTRTIPLGVETAAVSGLPSRSVDVRVCRQPGG